MSITECYVQPSVPPTDCLSSLSWSHLGDGFEMLLTTSWDGVLEVFAVEPTFTRDAESLTRSLVRSSNGNVPILCSAWSHDNQSVFLGNALNSVVRFDLATGRTTNIGKHDFPVSCMTQSEDFVITGSWDGTLRYWDPRSPDAAHIYNVGQKIYDVDAKGDYLVCCGPTKEIPTFNLRDPTKVEKVVTTVLKYQCRRISCFTSHTGFIVGGVEGRCEIQYRTPGKKAPSAQNFAFKCHRVNPKGLGKNTGQVYPVNQVVFHPIYETFVTCGGDGSLHSWDHVSKTRINNYTHVAQPLFPHNLHSAAFGNQEGREVPGNTPVCDAAYSASGTKLAYAKSYDFHQGTNEAFYNSETANYHVRIIQCLPEHVAPKRGR